MPSFDFGGRVRYVPGVYGLQRVQSDQAGAAPEFHVPVMLVGAPEGHPYNADTAGKAVQETPFTPFKLCKTSTAAETYFGPDSDAAIAMRWAKKHGLPYAYICCMAALTRAYVIVNSTGPILQYKLLPRKWGAPANHIMVKIVSGTTITFTPPKRYSMVTTNIGTTDTRIYVKDNSWVRIGMTLTIGSNTATNVTKTVLTVGTELTSTGQKRPYIDLSATVGTAYTTATYAIVLEYDTANAEVSTALANAQAQVDWINTNSKLFIAVKESTFTNPSAVIAQATSVVLKDLAAWEAVSKGTSPAPAAADYTTWVTLMDATQYDAFLQREGVRPQIYNVIDSSATIHGTIRDWALDKRAEGQAVAAITGTAWGDVVINASDSTDPGFRAVALDSQDMQICAGGLDKVAAYLSLSPAVFGLRVAGGLGHNLTNDKLLYTEVERVWDERNSGELTYLCKKGVTTYKIAGSSPFRYVVCEGLSTLQNNANGWNTVTNDTPLVMQRDMADYTDLVVIGGLDGEQLGADNISKDTLAACVRKRAQSKLVGRGLMTAFTITSIVPASNGAGWELEWGGDFVKTTDFIGVTTNIQI